MSQHNPFAGRRTRVLGMEDVRKLLDIDAGIEIQRQAFLDAARGDTTTAPNSWLRLPGERRGWLKLLAGYDGAMSALGTKVLARFPNNPPGANLGSILMLFDEDNGFPLAIMEGAYVTAVRTGAGAALATEAMARPDAASVGLIGTGVVAWYSLLAIKRVRKGLAQLSVCSRSKHRREAFAARARDELSMQATAVAHVEEAVSGVDIVITATNSPRPVLLAGHVEKGQLINAMGIKTEIEPEAVARCLVIGDAKEETLADGKFSYALSAGVVTPADLGPDLGEVLNGASIATSRLAIMFDSSGVAIQDVTCARWVWERADELGVGVLVDLGMDGSLCAQPRK
jgi:alanine dehydrogenase